MPCPTGSPAPAGSSWIFLFSLPHIPTTFFNLALGAGRETKPVPEASHTLPPVGKEGEFLHRSFPPAFSPAIPDKEGVSSPEPGPACAAGLFLPGLHNTPQHKPFPSLDLALAQPRGHRRAAREKPSPYFLADRFALGSFPCTLFRLGLVFFLVDLLFFFFFFFNALPQFPSY